MKWREKKGGIKKRREREEINFLRLGLVFSVTPIVVFTNV